MKKIKILFTIPNFDTAGSGIVVLKLATRLDASVFEPHICCMHDKGALFPRVRESGIPVHLQQYTAAMDRRVSGLRGCWTVSRFFRQFDLIHSFHYSDDYSEPIAARMAGIKWIYVKKNMSWGSRAWRLRTLLAHGVIAQNTDMMRLFFAGTRHVGLIPIGVDTEEFRPREPVKGLRTELGVPADAAIILTVANLVPVKGIGHLIEGFDAIAETNPRTWLVIVGDDRTPHGLELKHRAAALASASRIIFTGKRPDVSDFHSVARLFVLPSLAPGEGAPVSVLEAMAAGTLTLATDVAGIRDQLAQAPDQLFEPGSSGALAQKLTWALGLSESNVRMLVERQTKVVRERYTLELSIKQMERFYREVVSR